MLYQQPTFTLPACQKKLTNDEYDLRVGNISAEEYERRINSAKSKNDS